MKKLFAFATTATLLLGLASCSSELDAPEAFGDGNVNFRVTLPETPGTRAFSNGLTADDLQVAVYDVTDENNITLATTKDVEFGGKLETTVSLKLANGRSYKIAFFASLKANSPYTFDTTNKKITVDYSKMTQYNSTDNYDCFYQLYETGKVTGPINKTITLYRPVAQINWGTSDLTEDVLKVIYGANKDDEDLTKLYTKVTTKGYTEFDFFTKDVVTTSQTDVTYQLALRPAATENFPYQPTNDKGETVKTYDYLSMQYLLVPQASSIVDLKLESAAAADATETIAVVDVPNAPVQANYRTNIFGALLTNPAEFKVIKHEIYEDPDYDLIYGTSQLLEALKTPGATVKLASDLTVPSILTLNKDVVIDLNGHTLQTAGGTYGDAIEVKNGAKVVFKNGTIPSATNAKASSGIIYVSHSADVTLENVSMDSKGSIPVYVNGNNANVTITDCNITTNTTQVVYLDAAAGTGSKVIIEGGNYTAELKENGYATFTLNLSDKITKLEGFVPTNYIEVKGGKFYKYNPAESHSENPVVSFVAEGYESVQDGDYYIVRKKQ